MFSLKSIEKALVLLCFRSKMLKNHWFYCVFVQTCWKTIGFIVFSFANVSKMNVLRVLGPQNLIKLIQNLIFWSQCCNFSENPCVCLGKTQKSEKAITFYVKNCKNDQFCFVLLVFFAFLGLADRLGTRRGLEQLLRLKLFE